MLMWQWLPWVWASIQRLSPIPYHRGLVVSTTVKAGISRLFGSPELNAIRGSRCQRDKVCRSVRDLVLSLVQLRCEVCS